MKWFFWILAAVALIMTAAWYVMDVYSESILYADGLPLYPKWTLGEPLPWPPSQFALGKIKSLWLAFFIAVVAIKLVRQLIEQKKQLLRHLFLKLINWKK